MQTPATVLLGVGYSDTEGPKTDMAVAYPGSLFLPRQIRRMGATIPIVPHWLSKQNQSEAATPEPVLQGLSLALEGDGCRGRRRFLGAVQVRCARKGGTCSHPKLLPSCLHNISLPAVAAEVGEGLQEECKRVVRRKTRPGQNREQARC